MMTKQTIAMGVYIFLLSAGASANAAGDAARGKLLYETECGSCHSINQNRVGPAHKDVYGRKAGSVPDYDYSDAVKSSHIVWSDETLDQWLTDPEKLIPGQNMNFSVSSAQDRADIIAYLKKESGDEPGKVRSAEASSPP